MERLIKILSVFALKKEFVFRFESYDNSTISKFTNDTQVVEYEFFNSGVNSVININGLQVFSPDLNRQPQSVILRIQYNETDNTAYKFRFVAGGGAGATTHLLQVKEKIRAKFAKGAL